MGAQWRGSYAVPLVAAFVACAGSVACGGVTSPSAVTPATEEATKEPLPYDVVERAEVTFTARTKTISASGQAMTQWLAEQRVVCVGEKHTDPAHHYVQKEIIRRLSGWARVHGVPMAVGFEMFERPQQQYLDQLSRGWDLSTFAVDSGYAERWGFDFSLYRPLLEESLEGNANLLALNAPKTWTRAVAKDGLSAVDAELRAQFPELDLASAPHRAFFRAAMSGHPGKEGQHEQPHGKVGSEHTSHAGDGVTKQTDGGAETFEPALEAYYAAQVVWDETMAETASSWLSAAPANALMVLVAGNGHCHESAIPARIQRRTGFPVLSSRPIAESALDGAHVPNLDQFDALFIMAK